MRGTVADVLAGRADWAAGCCDGFAFARWLGPRSVDHVIGDPPYDEQTHDGARTTDARGNVIDGTPIDFAPLPPLDDFLPVLLACPRRWALLFCALEQLGDYKRAAGGDRGSGGFYVRGGIWHRTNSTPQVTGDRPGQGCEGIAIFHQKGGKMRWARGGDQAFWEGPIDHDPNRMHPTKKPGWSLERLLLDFTDPGDVVFDPTMGEGTTGEACIKLGRRFIGCEIANGIDPRTGKYDRKRDYFGAAVRRLERADARPKQAMLLGTNPIARPKQMGLALK